MFCPCGRSCDERRWAEPSRLLLSRLSFDEHFIEPGGDGKSITQLFKGLLVVGRLSACGGAVVGIAGTHSHCCQHG